MEQTLLHQSTSKQNNWRIRETKNSYFITLCIFFPAYISNKNYGDKDFSIDLNGSFWKSNKQDSSEWNSFQTHEYSSGDEILQKNVEFVQQIVSDEEVTETPDLLILNTDYISNASPPQQRALGITETPELLILPQQQSFETLIYESIESTQVA